MSRYAHYALRSETGGWAHRLDARAKVIVLMVMSVAVWSVETGAGLGMILLLCGSWLAASGAGGKKVLAGLRRLWIVLLFVVLYYLWAVYSIRGGFGLEGLPGVFFNSLMLCGKLAALVATALWLYHSTPPMRVVDSLSRMLRPLEKLHVPVGELSFTVGLVIRSFPSALTRIRGLFGNFRRQYRLAGRSDRFPASLASTLRAVVDTMVCYMHYTLYEAEQLSLSLLARGYNPFTPPSPGGRHWMSPGDWLFCLASSAVIILSGVYL
ncbi:MAG: energy-coupling factor transporter transmembrane protein EcfT [Candidatus Glassbacteria bacterium]|nr:energy-coupling factor transporter transmembrane protein EcfT [Candidatus Glassbacteria bacterium]